MGIYNMIQLSKIGPGYSQNMLVASLYFWDTTHNTFYFPCRMMTPTLFDIVAMADIQLTRDAFDPKKMNEDTINFDAHKATLLATYLNTTTP